MELLAQFVTSPAYDQSSVIGSVGEQVDETLETAESWFCGILVLVRPRAVGFQVFAAGEADIDGVKRDDKVLSVVHLLESINNPCFRTDRPGKGLVRHTIAVAHALLADYGKVVFVDGRGVIAFETKSAESAM